MAKAAAKSSAVIQRPNIFSVCLEVIGITPLIQNCFNQKAIEEMLRKHMGLSTQREKKIPMQCVELATIRNAKGEVCIPTTAFKKAMLAASTTVKGLKKTQLRIGIFIEGSAIPIKFSRMVPQMDMVRLSGMSHTPDVRFRPRFEDWSARMTIQFSESIPVQTVVDLLNRAGSVGVGEWRPEKDGPYGQFEVTRNITDSKEIKEVHNLCKTPIPALTIPDWAMNAELTPELLKRLGKGDDSEDGSEDE